MVRPLPNENAIYRIKMSNQENKKLALAFWKAIDRAGACRLAPIFEKYLSPSCIWIGPAPIYRQEDARAILDNFWIPLKLAIPDLERDTHMMFGGASSGRLDGEGDGHLWVCGTGYLTGRATGSFLDIPSTEKKLRLRWGEFLRFEKGLIVEVQMMLDFVDWFDQVGLSVLPTQRGTHHVYPPPTGCHGVLLEAQDPFKSNETLKLGRDFLFGALNGYDKQDLGSMGMPNYFHKNVKWYGPGGIGACLSLKEFQEYHQKPWLQAFPDRKVQNLDALFAEGNFLAAKGVTAVKASHSGPYLGVPASGKTIYFSGLDFWLRMDDKFTENWVFVDMIDLFLQMDHDLFENMRIKAREMYGVNK